MSDDTRVIDLVVPRLGETMEEATVREWLCALGDSFKRGDAVVEVETDKTIAEVPAMMAGKLVEILAEPDERVAVGAVIGRIEVASLPVSAAEPAPASADSLDSGAVLTPAVEPVIASEGKSPVVRSSGEPVRATPAARRIARERGIAIEKIPGSGRLGRIEIQDVLEISSGNARVASGSESGLAYDQFGPVDGVPFLLLHGFAADRSSWAALARALAKAGYRVTVPDLPGHGQTSIEASHPDELQLGLGDLVQALVRGTGSLHIIAHSVGAAPALALARYKPLASLTLVAPAGLGATIDSEFLQGMASVDNTESLAQLLRRLSQSMPPLSEQALQGLLGDLQRGRLTALANSLSNDSGQTLDLVPAIRAASSDMPVRVVVGHADRIIDWRDACRLSPAVAIHHLPDVGHIPQQDAARDLFDIVSRGVRP